MNTTNPIVTIQAPRVRAFRVPLQCKCGEHHVFEVVIEPEVDYRSMVDRICERIDAAAKLIEGELDRIESCLTEPD